MWNYLKNQETSKTHPQWNVPSLLLFPGTSFYMSDDCPYMCFLNKWIILRTCIGKGITCIHGLINSKWRLNLRCNLFLVYIGYKKTVYHMCTEKYTHLSTYNCYRPSCVIRINHQYMGYTSNWRNWKIQNKINKWYVDLLSKSCVQYESRYLTLQMNIR